MGEVAARLKIVDDSDPANRMAQNVGQHPASRLTFKTANLQNLNGTFAVPLKLAEEGFPRRNIDRKPIEQKLKSISGMPPHKRIGIIDLAITNIAVAGF